MGVGFDFTGPVNNQLAYRFIGLGKKSENGVDFQEGERFMFAPSFTLRPTDATTITISALYQRDPKSLDAGFVPAYGSVLPIPGFGKVPKSFWQGDPAWNEFDRTQAYIGLEFQHRFSEDWKVTARMRYGHQESTTKAMDYTAMVDPTTMMRTIYLAEHDSNMFNADVFTERKFTTGALQHTVVLGVDHQKLTGGFEDGWDRFQYPTINIFNPVRGVTPNAFDTFRVFEQPFEQTGVYLQDQIALGGLRLMGGLRYDRAQSSSSVLVTLNGLSTEASTTDTELTGRVGAAYVFDNGFAPFISYGTSFNPQPAFKPDGSMLTPYTGKMLEAGVRYQSPNSRLFWSATAYTGVKDGVGATAACTFPGAIGLDRCFTDDTEADNKGIELEARAELYSGLDVIASATWQNVRWTEVAGIAVDNHVVGVPDRMAALWLNYTVPEGMFGYGWSVGGGVRYIGTTYATDSNVWGASEGAYAGEPSKVDAFTLFDAAVGYDFKALSREYDGIKARLTASNLFDKSYVAACNGYGTCSFGKGREVLLKLSYTW